VHEVVPDVQGQPRGCTAAAVPVVSGDSGGLANGTTYTHKTHKTHMTHMTHNQLEYTHTQNALRLEALG